jgi:hypothetical protein
MKKEDKIKILIQCFATLAIFACTIAFVEAIKAGNNSFAIMDLLLIIINIGNLIIVTKRIK